MQDLTIRNETLHTPSVVRLIADLNAELSKQYPEEGANHFRLEADELTPGRGAFLVAYDGDEPVACGAIRLLDKTTAEIKRMYVVPRARGRGISRYILDALEARAQELGAQRVVLETGARQRAAIGLYQSSGYEETLLFGEYVGSPLSLCMSKQLGPTNARGAPGDSI